MTSKPEFTDTPEYYQADKYSQKYRTDVVFATDWLGHKFRVGDVVMYCVGAGRGQLMAIGQVQKMRAVWGRRYKWETNEFIEDWDVEVQVRTSKTSGAWDNKARVRPAWVNPLNITAIPEGFEN